MDFSSDTSAPADPAILEAVAKANQDFAPSYGADDLNDQVRSQLCDLFETEIDVLLVSSGTAANALALAVTCPSTGSVLCHEEAHIERDERGAPEFFTGGGKLHLLPGAHGKIDSNALADALLRRNPGFVHETPAQVLSLTNLTECGTAYTVDELVHRTHQATDHGLSIHLDGARLANAVIACDATPADLSWKAGVDVVTFGATKNGAIGCEAVILFGTARSRFPDLKARAKRAGHLPPKMRYLAAQMHAYLKDDLWRTLATKANAKARNLATGLLEIDGVTLAHPADGNEVFANLTRNQVEILQNHGAKFYPWLDGSQRFVCSFATPDSHVDLLLQTLSQKK